MTYNERVDPPRQLTAKTLLRKHKRIDSWFVSRYGMNLYRGCPHACAYCDGRAERYHVEGDFDRDVAVKINAPELLARELDPRRKRKPMKRGYVFLGGGIGDAYGPPEREHRLARRSLEVLAGHPFPVHVLTKSPLVERDLDLLAEIDAGQRAIVSTSLSTVDDDLARVFEPGCAPPSERLAMLGRIKAAGLAAGVYLMPVLPLLSDSDDSLEQALVKACEVGADFVVFSGLTLKPGRQMEHYLGVLDAYQPGLVDETLALYPGQRWGGAAPGYYQDLERRFTRLAQRHRMARRIPPRLFIDLLDDNDRAVVLLEHLDYFQRAEGRKSFYGLAARSIAALDRPLTELRDDLQSLRGVGAVTQRLLLEILDTGTCRYYDTLA